MYLTLEGLKLGEEIHVKYSEELEVYVITRVNTGSSGLLHELREPLNHVDIEPFFVAGALVDYINIGLLATSELVLQEDGLFDADGTKVGDSPVRFREKSGGLYIKFIVINYADSRPRRLRGYGY